MSAHVRTGFSGLAVVAVAAWALTAMNAGALAQSRARGNGPDAAAAWLVQDLDGREPDRESRPELLDAPVLPGSIAKAITLVAALETHVLEPDSARMCRRVVTVDGVRYVCSHPDLKRPLTPAEALAHSCNDFFVSLASRLSRGAVNDVRTRMGLVPVSTGTTWSAALVGLDGPRTSPRLLLGAMTRLVGIGRRRVQVSSSTRRVLIDGLAGAATYGSASELAGLGVRAWAKTGTSSMPGGGSLGLVVAFEPADAPRRGLVVVAPGAAGRDATSIAGDLLAASPRRIRIGSPQAGRSTDVRTMEIEDYVARVVSAEGVANAPDAATQALAIAVRTYALANEGRHAREGFDLCDTTHCQVLARPTPAASRAAAATTGRVLLHEGRPASIFYSASCGGQSELPSRVWAGAADPPFLRAQRDAACGVESPWTSDLSALDLERSLRAAGLKGTALRSLTIVARSPTGRVTRLRADGFVPAEVSGEAFRLAVGRTAGWNLLKSTLFDLRRSARGYVATGRGFGHGVGMCVSEAACRAASGATARDILAFSYPGLTIGVARAQDRVSTTPTVARTAAGVGSRVNIELALPTAEEREREAIQQLLRRAVDDIAARVGLPLPDVIRVTVHPNVTSFSRASRQPWWVAGSTRGTDIDLLPISVLRRRGILDQTMRHELAHLMMEPTLASRPMWVREGAAAYFANPTKPVLADVGTCPSDEELVTPASADAQRDAYARAEQCFRRQLASGVPWSAVR